MKKIITLLASAFIIAGSAFAQDSFTPSWQLGLKGGIAYSAGEASFSDLLSPVASLSAGYQFTPVFSLRGELSGWQSKGVINGAQASIYKFNYGQLNIDGVFDVCNMFKYNSSRRINPYVLAGIGTNVRFNNQEAFDLKPFMYSTDYVWGSPILSITGRVGAGVDFKLSNAISLCLEVADNFYSDRFNSKENLDKVSLFNDRVKLDLDYIITTQLGLKFNFGGSAAKGAAVASAAAAAAAQKAEAENAAAERAAAEKAAVEKAAAEKAAAEKAAAEKAAAEKAAAEKAAAERAQARRCQENIYFVIGKYDIRECETPKIDRLIDILKTYPEAVVTIAGYADKDTGNASINLSLSKNRANVIAKAIEAAGISADRISIKFFGDTEKVSSVPAENRVSVCTTE